MIKSSENKSAATGVEHQQDNCEGFSDSSNHEVLIQVSQLINWVNTYAVYHSKGDPNTKTFMDGFSLIQGLQSQIESTHTSNAIREAQVSNVNKEKSALEQENEKLRQQIKEQSAQVEKFKKRNAKLENHEKKVAIREVMPLGKLKCKVANLQLVFETLVSKLEREPLNKEDALAVQRKRELGEFRRDIGDLFGRVKHNMIKWEKNQTEMVGKLERTRVGLNSLNETVMPALADIPFAEPSKSQLKFANEELHPTTLLKANAKSKLTVAQSTGNLNFEVTNEPSTSSGCKPKSKKMLCGISVRSALSKHIKSRKISKSNDMDVQSTSHQIHQSTASTSIPVSIGLEKNMEPVLPISVNSNTEYIDQNAGNMNNVGENMELPQKPNSPIVCGLCGSGFSTLVQLKLHHAVFHSESNGPAVRLNELHHEPLPRNARQPHEAAQFAEYILARQANQGASSSASANMEQYLMQCLIDLATGIAIPSTQKPDDERRNGAY